MHGQVLNSILRLMLANGMVLLFVYFVWGVVLLSVGTFALLALVLSIVRRTRKGSRVLALISLVVSAAPFIVPVIYAKPLASYGRGEAVLFIAVSLLPLVMSVAAVYYSRKPGSPDSEP